MNTMKITTAAIIALLLTLAPMMASATDQVGAGKIEKLSYRGGYVTFDVVDDNGFNICSPCPGDPGNMRTGGCWIPHTESAQLSMLLLAYSNGQRINGRVLGLTTDCTLYQMTLIDPT